jgi:hypothetical protein
VPSDLTARRPRPTHRPFLVFLAGLSGCFLVLAYVPSLADSLESLVLVQPPPTRPGLSPDSVSDAPAVQQPPALPADEAALDDDTPVIGVLASGRARAYLVEALEQGASSHVVNDVLGGVPVSVTHCDLSGCTRVFSGATPGRPLELSVGGINGYRLVLKVDDRRYRQETSAPLDGGSPPFPYREYPAERTTWGAWRRAHPGTDVYMGSVDEATATEAGRPVKVQSSRAPSSGASP